MNDPFLIIEDSFQDAWIKAIIKLKENNWEMFNLLVNIKNPTLFNTSLNDYISDFLKYNTSFSAKDVAYTIFPHNLYEQYSDKEKLFSKYMSRIYPWTRKKPHKGWGTYFGRMINYERDNMIINQLGNIINAINDRGKTSKAAFTIMIEKPGGETVRPLGAPCLNYIAVQIEHNKHRRISLLCVYRNHDFFRRAYGNYWGICNLLRFLASETNSKIGTITCISSHAYVDLKKTKLKEFMTTNGWI